MSQQAPTENVTNPRYQAFLDYHYGNHMLHHYSQFINNMVINFQKEHPEKNIGKHVVDHDAFTSYIIESVAKANSLQEMGYGDHAQFIWGDM